ncbi:MAG: hypothetical protein PHV34_22570 [Verrucomicrobiae bacterium]|nr:hypothetical protein [Verrucomicrobiae bacterium]
MNSSFSSIAAMLLSSACFTFAVAQNTTTTTAISTNLSLQTSTSPAAPAPKPEATAATPSAIPATSAADTSKKKVSYIAPNGKIPGDQKGPIEKLDAAAGTFVIDGKTFKLAPHGKVYVNNDLKSLTDLKDGDLVAVTFRESADGLSATLVIKGSRPRKARKAKAEAAEEKSAEQPKQAD